MGLSTVKMRYPLTFRMHNRSSWKVDYHTQREHALAMCMWIWHADQQSWM